MSPLTIPDGDATPAMPLLDGPRLAPLAEGAARGLVVLLHGYGSSGRALIGLAEQVRPLLPDVAFVAPHGPLEAPYGGRCWFAVTRQDMGDAWRGAVGARPLLDFFLDNERDRLGLADGRIALVGFSQGAVMALHVGLRRPAAPGAIVGYSGFLAGAEYLDEITARPPVTLVHGDEDRVIPPRALPKAAAALRAAGVPVTALALPSVGHSIDAEGLQAGVEAVRKAFGGG